jgi:hypothetical protein
VGIVSSGPRAVRVTVMSGLVVVALALISSAAPVNARTSGTSHGQVSTAGHFRFCGVDKALRVRISVYRVSCHSARRIVTAYLRGNGVNQLPRTVKGFPRWTCSTGSDSGSCDKGEVRRESPIIGFFYVS